MLRWCCTDLRYPERYKHLQGNITAILFMLQETLCIVNVQQVSGRCSAGDSFVSELMSILLPPGEKLLAGPYLF